MARKDQHLNTLFESFRDIRIKDNEALIEGYSRKRRAKQLDATVRTVCKAIIACGLVFAVVTLAMSGSPLYG